MAERTIVTLGDTLAALVEGKKYTTLRDILVTMNAVDVAAVFEDMPQDKLPLLFRLLPKELAAETFVEMAPEAQELLIQGFSDNELKEVVDELYVDDAVDIVEEMPANVVKRILQVGLPAGFQGVIFSLSNVVIQSSINSFGDTVMAGSAAAQNIEGFVYAAMNAFYQSALTFSGQNYGAGKCDRVDKVALYCQGFVILTGLILGNLAFFFGSQLLGIYAPGEPDVIQQGLGRMSYIGRLYAICGIMDTMVGILRGIGYSIVPMVVSLLGSCVLRLLWVWFVFPLDPVPGNLYISYPITWAITGAVHIIMFLAIRKKAYAKVQGSGPSYLSVDGHHPEATEQ